MFNFIILLFYSLNPLKLLIFLKMMLLLNFMSPILLLFQLNLFVLSMKLSHFQISISIYSYLFNIVLSLFSILIDKIPFIFEFLYFFVLIHLTHYKAKLLIQYLHYLLNHLCSLTNFCIIYSRKCQYHLKLYPNLIYCQMVEAQSVYFIIFL